MTTPAQRVLVRQYVGTQEGAMAQFRRDAEKLGVQGYFPTSQTWAPGQYGCGSFIVALLLCIILIGIIVFIYMLFVKPDGTLSVTYEYRAPVDAAAGRTCPRCAETVKAAAAICRFCGYEFTRFDAVPAPAAPQLRTAPTASPLDPFALARLGGTELHDKLLFLSTDDLRIVARECGMDERDFVKKWSRRDIVAHIERQARELVQFEPKV